MQHVVVCVCDEHSGSEFLTAWHLYFLFIIRQLRRMTKRPRGRKRIISPELIAFPEIRRGILYTTYLPTYSISFACKLQLSRYLELRDAGNLIFHLWESLIYLYFRGTRPSGSARLFQENSLSQLYIWACAISVTQLDI